MRSAKALKRSRTRRRNIARPSINLKPVIAIWTKPDGKYTRITGYEFGKAREPGEDDDVETVTEDETTTTETDIWEDEIPW